MVLYNLKKVCKCHKITINDTIEVFNRYVVIKSLNLLLDRLKLDKTQYKYDFRF